MRNARNRIDRLFEAAPAPVAPPKPAPTKPAPRPAPSPHTPDPDIEDPWRKKDLKPGTEPGPKARLRSEAKQFLRLNGLGDFL